MALPPVLDEHRDFQPDLDTKLLREPVEAHRDEIKAIVARHHGRSVAIFGSVARGDEHVGSGIDLLVEFEPGARPIEILSIGVELEEALGVKVDVGTPASLRERVRDAIDAIRDHLTRGDLDDGLVHDAVRVRSIEIGGAVKGIDPDLLDEAPAVPWREISRMQDQLAHRYFDTDRAIVQDVVANDLGPLFDAV